MATRIHHLDCGSMRPVNVGGLGVDRVVAHCLLVERAEGLVLIDTGFGLGQRREPTQLRRHFVAMMRPSLDEGEAAVRQLAALGFDADDVTDVVLTHLDRDHAGGLPDLPQARVHVDFDEHRAALHPRGLKERERYTPGIWKHGPRWELHDTGGDDWFGFEGVRVIGEDVVTIPLRGHTHGHVGVAVRRPDGGWLLHAGDAYFTAGEAETPPSYKPGMVAFQKYLAVDEKARRANQERLRELRAGHEDVTVFCAHSGDEYDALAGA